MHDPVEELYFNWLCAKVLEDQERPDYWDLLSILHRYEFVPTVQGDYNRASSGLGVRQEFIRMTQYGRGPDWDHIGCSVFEMLMALANDASWQTSEPLRVWFWRFIQNLQLEDYRRVDPDDIPDIEEKLFAFVWRQYDDNGFGGIFPLRMTEHDQRMVEIWYQLAEYVDENRLI